MKYLLTVLSLSMIALSSRAQFFSFDFTAYKTKIDVIGWGLDLNGGTHIGKNNNGIMVGLGTGIHMLDGSPGKLYIPVYAQALYYKAKHVINPYVNARVGHAFYNGGAKFIEKDNDIKGGLYANIRIGAGIRGYNGFSAIPFVGCSFMRFRYNQLGIKGNYNNAFFNAGLSFFFK